MSRKWQEKNRLDLCEHLDASLTQKKKVNPPNIFDYATSELSQDAFFAWLLKWGEEKYKDYPLNKVAVDLLKLFYGNSLPLIVDEIEVCTQYKHIDIWVKINEKYNLIIEDKTNTQFHGNQLDDYKEIFEKIEESKKKFVYLKTGNISKNEREKVCSYYKYKVISSDEILSVFEKYKNIDNNFYNDFKAYLKTKKLLCEMKDYFRKATNKKKIKIEYKSNTHALNCFYFWFTYNKIGEQYLAIDVWINSSENKLTFLLHGKTDAEGTWMEDMSKLKNLIDNLAPKILKDKKFKPSFSAYKYEFVFKKNRDAIEETEKILKLVSDCIE